MPVKRQESSSIRFGVAGGLPVNNVADCKGEGRVPWWMMPGRPTWRANLTEVWMGKWMFVHPS